MKTDEVRARCLALVPDLPRWVETCALLRSADASVLAYPAYDGFVVWSEGAGLGSVVGDPEFSAVARAAAQVPELLAFADDVDRGRAPHAAYGETRQVGRLGAVESNRASANLARRLGFVEADELWVLTRSAP